MYICVFEEETERQRQTHKENILKNSFCKFTHTHTQNTCAMDMATILFPISLILLPISYHKCQNSWTETGCRRTQTPETQSTVRAWCLLPGRQWTDLGRQCRRTGRAACSETEKRTRKQEAAAGGKSRGERREHVAGSWADLNDGHQLCPLILCEPAVNDVPNHKDTVSWNVL